MGERDPMESSRRKRSRKSAGGSRSPSSSSPWPKRQVRWWCRHGRSWRRRRPRGAKRQLLAALAAPEYSAISGLNFLRWSGRSGSAGSPPLLESRVANHIFGGAKVPPREEFCVWWPCGCTAGLALFPGRSDSLQGLVCRSRAPPETRGWAAARAVYEFSAVVALPLLTHSWGQARFWIHRPTTIYTSGGTK